MINFKTILQQFKEQGEKTGWTYIEVSAEMANLLKQNNKKSYRVKLLLDNHLFTAVAMIPMGEGNFIVAINATMRNTIKKRKGDTVDVQIEIDEKGYELNADFITCLQDDEQAHSFFNSLPKSHQTYFSKWIDSAKTMETKAKRIATCIQWLSRKLGYGDMIRGMKNKL